MKLSVGCNWDPNLIDSMASLPVYTLYGRPRRGLIGGGRPSYLIPDISDEDMRTYISNVHKKGMEFNYLFNSMCLGNQEFMSDSHHKILEEIDKAVEMGIDSVTVTIPYLAQIIKYRYPKIKVGISVYSFVTSVEKAKRFESIGADIITVPEVVNRDFKMLEAMRKSVSCDIQVIANNTCLYGCMFQLYHGAITSHAAQDDEKMRGFYIDYCILNCTKRKLSNPAEIIKSRWIRPEDIKTYEDIGIDHFKLVERFNTTEVLTNIAKAYADRRYDGNLFDILDTKTDPKRQVPLDVSVFDRPECANVGELMNFEDALYVKGQYINNRDLDGFLEFYKNHDCNRTSCEQCNYCSNLAKKVYQCDKDKINETLEHVDRKIDALVTSEFFDLKPKEETDEITWDKESNKIFLELIECVDENVRDIAKKFVKMQAEENARLRKGNTVNTEDMVNAFLSVTPQSEQKDMKLKLVEYGLL